MIKTWELRGRAWHPQAKGGNFTVTIWKSFTTISDCSVASLLGSCLRNLLVGLCCWQACDTCSRAYACRTVLLTGVWYVLQSLYLPDCAADRRVIRAPELMLAGLCCWQACDTCSRAYTCQTVLLTGMWYVLQRLCLPDCAADRRVIRAPELIPARLCCWQACDTCSRAYACQTVLLTGVWYVLQSFTLDSGV